MTDVLDLAALLDKERERQQHVADRRNVASALRRLGLPVPERFDVP